MMRGFVNYLLRHRELISIGLYPSVLVSRETEKKLTEFEASRGIYFIFVKCVEVFFPLKSIALV